MNTTRDEAYREMLARGFGIEMQGVEMHRSSTDGYSRAGLFVIDDLR